MTSTSFSFTSAQRKKRWIEFPAAQKDIDYAIIVLLEAQFKWTPQIEAEIKVNDPIDLSCLNTGTVKEVCARLRQLGPRPGGEIAQRRTNRLAIPYQIFIQISPSSPNTESGRTTSTSAGPSSRSSTTTSTRETWPITQMCCFGQSFCYCMLGRRGQKKQAPHVPQSQSISWVLALPGKQPSIQDNYCTGMDKIVGPRLRESHLLTPFGRGTRVHAT